MHRHPKREATTEMELRKKLKYAHIHASHFLFPVTMESLGAMWTEARQFLIDLDRYALQPQLLICVSQIPPAMSASSHSGL